MANSTSPSRVQPLAEAVVVVEAALQRLLLAAHQQPRAQLQAERLLFPLELLQLRAEDAARPHQRVRSRLRLVC